MSSDKIVLYDLPGKDTPPTCWSPNVWKTRLVLNYKNIPYETQWLKHPEIQPALTSCGIPPNPPNPQARGQSDYTLPTIGLPDGTYSMDSANIAPLLEEKYPEPSLHLDTGMHQQALAALGQIAPKLLGVLFPLIMRRQVPDDVAPMWRQKREAQFGCTVEEFEAAKGGDPAWEAAKPGFENLRKFLNDNKKDEGPYILGSQVCYGDFILAGMAQACFRIGDDLYERLMENVPEMRVLHKACKKWFEKDT